MVQVPLRGVVVSRGGLVCSEQTEGHPWVSPVFAKETQTIWFRPKTAESSSDGAADLRQRRGWIVAAGAVGKRFAGKLKTLPHICRVNAGAGGDAAGPALSPPGSRRLLPALVMLQGHILRLSRVTSGITSERGQRHPALNLKQHSLQNPTSACI